MKKPIYIDRPPRIQPELPIGQHDIPKPPQHHDDVSGRLIQIGLPLITIIGYIFMSVMLGGRGGNMALMLPMGLSVVAAIAFSLYSFRRERQRREALDQAYANRLVELNKEMQTAHDLQRRFYHYNYPATETTLRIVQQAVDEVQRKERTLRSESRLWERRSNDLDFGCIRLGLGTLPSTVIYKLNDQEQYASPQLRAAQKLESDSHFVDNIPVIIQMRHTPEEKGKATEKSDKDIPIQAPVVHALGIAGEQNEVYSFAQALIAHYTVFHAPSDARLYLLASDDQPWSWAEQLPHASGDEQNRFCCFINKIKPNNDPNPFDDDEGGELEKYLEGLRRVLAQRKIRLQEREENQNNDDPTLPFLLIVVDLHDATYNPNSPLQGIEGDPALAILLEEGHMLGASVIFLVPERSKVPSGCQAVIEVERTSPATNSRFEQNQKLHFRYTEVGVNHPRYVGEADAISQPQQIQKLAQDMAEVQIRQGAGANLASTVPFLDLMGFSTMEDLVKHAKTSWDRSAEARYANWMRVKIGMMAGNKPRTLVFSAKRDGVHGMIAGSTGSGKSELLISMLAGLAVTYDPSVLNFVLVDYKGGGAFKEFADLPHCVDIITNLAGDGVTRMFTAIDAEMKRRQALNAETSTKNIVEYRQKGLHLTHKPYPFLFIVIDEFAEMIADRAEYKRQLESITRVGRAQGVSLILAAQRPSGVTDQMRSNIKFRISLRVESASESREMLRRADAAYLPTGIPGRGYLQVGNEEIELLQVAYSGDIYSDPNAAKAGPVLWPDRQGLASDVLDQTPPELYKVIIAELSKLAKQQGRPKQLAPWPNFLPNQLALGEPLISDDPDVKTVTSSEYLVQGDMITLGQPAEATLTLNPAINRWLDGHNGWLNTLDWERYAMRPVVGLIDNPHAAQQLPLVVDLSRGHAIIFGTSGSGKTSFIRSLITSLAVSHSPNTFHAYIFDLGGRNLSVLDKLPHVGAVVTPEEEGYQERISQILREIEEMIETRKKVFSEAGVNDLYDYNRRYPSKLLPAIVLAIDNFGEFIDLFGGNSGGDVATILEQFTALARQSNPYGVHIVLSMAQLGNLSNQIFNIFSERYTLRLVDPGEYRGILGVGVNELGDISGRGYTRVGQQALSFQVAQPFEKPQNDANFSELRELEALAKRMHGVIAQNPNQYKLPLRVDALPTTVLFRHMLAEEYGLALDEKFLPNLKEKMQAEWAASKTVEKAAWLRAPIAIASGNRPRTLMFEAKEDGVHGMIAGGTGAGKSEVLMSLIVSMAIKYDPSILNFLLVDFKGGGAFAPFKDLPHCVETITNLNKAGVKRMFTAINAEMRRRQALNAATGTKDIVEYRQKGLHLSREPYPHLFIIIDEYAEMISENPEFGAELDSITRVGRAQGVHLLLASQRPTGVSDQMRANIKLRICLRVEGVETSREMLRRPDAAYLPSIPGRGYLQVGNEQIELLQMAYIGEEYQYAPQLENGEKPKFYNVVVDLAKELLASQRPSTPWPPFLDSAITFSTPLRQRYLTQASQAAITLGHSRWLALNPFIQEWQEGKGKWHGIDWKQQAMRAVVGLIDDPYNAQQLPLIIDFTRGHAVVFGASGWGKTTLLRSLVLSLAATHSPSEFHAHILDLGGRNLEVLEALPHVGTIIMPDERGYEERIQQLWRELNEELNKRKSLFSHASVSTLYEYNATHPDKHLPAILVAIDNIAEFIESFGSGKQAEDETNPLVMFVSLARQGRAYGLHVIITANRLNVLSSKLYSLFTERYALRLADSEEYSSIVGTQVNEAEEVSGRGYTRVGRMALAFQVALPPGSVDQQKQVNNEKPQEQVSDEDQQKRVSSEIHQIRLAGEKMQEALKASQRSYPQPFKIAALPTKSSFRDLIAEIFQISKEPQLFLDELSRKVRERWEENASAEHANWLRAPLGITSGNKIRILKLEAKEDGVHGMVAGGTGSGKSELLMTLIVGLALNYSPDILNFVLVDYKGGGAFTPFAKLPHCVDIVTNLNKAAVERMFTAINAEIRRRQALNASTGTKDIVEYRQKGLHLRHQPYPHLFIIIDEYAEMISDNEEYLRELESITRVGRAQGINLILASQQPKGVTDQMRANIKLRLCLWVEQADTSRELLRRPDAAQLPSIAGRGYLQAGNENLELIQVAYSGEDQSDTRAAGVLWPDLPEHASAADGESPRFFDMVVKITSEIAGKPAPRPWPAFLPNSLSLETPINDGKQTARKSLNEVVSDWVNNDSAQLWPGIDWQNQALRPRVGIVDDPAEARQDPLQFDLTRSHLAIFGDAGMGKTSLIRTIITDLAASHRPDEVQFYILDMGGQSFRSFEALPHMGAIISADEENFSERLQRLLDHLQNVVEERQQLLSDADCSNLFEYNSRNPQRTLPAIVLCIDNFIALMENYDVLVEAMLMPLTRRSLSVGIALVLATNLHSHLPSRFLSMFGERITFKQSNTDAYLDIVGRGAAELDDLPGRGYIRKDRRPLAFQAALPVGVLDEEGRPQRPEAEELRQLGSAMALHAQSLKLRSLPTPIRVLPQLVSLEEMLARQSNSGRSAQIVVGQGGDLEVAEIDLQRSGPHFMIVGPPLSGKTTALYNMVFALAQRYEPSNAAFILVDLQRRFVEYGGYHSLKKLPHTLAVINEIAELEALLPQLQAEVSKLAEQSQRELFMIIDDFDDFSEEIQRMHDLSDTLTMLVRRYGRDGFHVIAASSPEGNSSDLKRRIMASNYGLGLRTASAIEALRVMRTPAGVRDKELILGRGYIAKSGQTSMVQVGSPFHRPDQTHYPVEISDFQRSDALDNWVDKICQLYSERAAWSAQTEQSVSSPSGPAPNSPEYQRILNIQQALRKYMLSEIKYLNQHNGDRPLILQRFVVLESSDWHNPATLSELLKESYIASQIALGFDRTMIQDQVKDWGDDDFLFGLEGINSL